MTPTTPRLKAPVTSEAYAMPPHHGVGSNDGERTAGFRKQVTDPTQEHPVDGRKRARAADAGALQGLFHRLSEDDIYTRFSRGRSLSYPDLQTLYFLSPTTNLAEVAFMVAPEFQGAGLGTALQTRLQ